MQRKLVLMIVAGILCLSLAGCGQSGDTQPEEEDPVQSQQPVDESSEADSSEEETQGPADPEAPETAQYTDNCSVDEAAVAAFAEQIRAKGYTVRCEREMGPGAPVRCRTKVRYHDGLRPEEVSL